MKDEHALDEAREEAIYALIRSFRDTDRALHPGYAGYIRATISFEITSDNDQCVDLPMRLFQLAEHPETQVGFVDSEAREFSRLIALRYLLEADDGWIALSKLASKQSDRLSSWFKEALAIELHPFVSRLSPLEALDVVRELPDTRLLKRLYVLEDWMRPSRYYGHTRLVTMGMANPDEGSIRLFRPPSGRLTRDTVFHEWAHLLKVARPIESRLFDMVGTLEPIQTCSRSDAHQNSDETWAVLVGEGLVSNNFHRAIATAFNNPIRSTIAALALKDVLSSVPPAQRSTLHQQYCCILRYIENIISARAAKCLLEFINGCSTTDEWKMHDAALEILKAICESKAEA